jgi:hypothetical protein
VAVYAGLLEPKLARVTGLVACVGAGLLLLALWRRMHDVLPWALFCGGGAYALALVVHGSSVNGAAPLVGAALLLCAELASWSFEQRFDIAAERGVLLRRVGALAALVVGGLLAGGLVLAVSVTPTNGSILWTLLGAISAVGIVALAAKLAR